jgi:DtxR family Mn-dependent transcriptional regulator
VVNSAPATHNARYLSKATGDILKAIHSLQGGADAAITTNVALPSEIAARTGTSRAFVTKMLKQMKQHELVEYTPYRGVRLTGEGTRVALEMARHHRLLEVFLANTLGFPLEAAHAEAERLEHVMSEEFEARLDAFLGHPCTCPHGAPIPNADGSYPDAL